METITKGKSLPNFTDEEVLDWFGDRGVYSDSVEQFKTCFDIFEHKEGVFSYRLKSKKEWKKIDSSGKPSNFFSGVILHDPMETLILREYCDDINRIHTHYTKTFDSERMRGDEIDVIENQ